MLYPTVDEDDNENDHFDEDFAVTSESDNNDNTDAEEEDIRTLVNPVIENTMTQWQSSQWFSSEMHENFWRNAPYNLIFHPPNMNNERGFLFQRILIFFNQSQSKISQVDQYWDRTCCIPARRNRHLLLRFGTTTYQFLTPPTDFFWLKYRRIPEDFPLVFSDIFTNSNKLTLADLGMYLGVPCIHLRITTKTFSYVVEKRLHLGDDQGTRIWHTIAWPVLCKPKKLGGLGFKRLKEYNQGFLSKLAWRLQKDGNALWAKELISKYVAISKYWCNLGKKQTSYLWRQLSSQSTASVGQFNWKMENGSNVRF
ncbi:hypothetical protein M9H77_09445 [Catharanthus roseus]|uniref:Uncharacterized protein n=1 Tax=Catharanthus roseus TaxID=4058 RepID=A0ACC0C0S9_CATRO|nr:hypothetical protein M9H77_09445 [Catharanthus roseus]